MRDFLLGFRKDSTGENPGDAGPCGHSHHTPLAVGAAYLIYTTPDGLYKYLQAVSIYLVMPVTPAIFFGIMSKRMTFQGAVASAITGTLIASVFVADQLVNANGAQIFPGPSSQAHAQLCVPRAWGTLIATGVLFLVSYSTRPPDSARVKSLTVDWQVAQQCVSKAFPTGGCTGRCSLSPPLQFMLGFGNRRPRGGRFT